MRNNRRNFQEKYPVAMKKLISLAKKDAINNDIPQLRERFKLMGQLNRISAKKVGGRFFGKKVHKLHFNGDDPVNKLWFFKIKDLHPGYAKRNYTGSEPVLDSDGNMVSPLETGIVDLPHWMGGPFISEVPSNIFIYANTLLDIIAQLPT